MNFTLKDVASYRTKGASKATPGFDVDKYVLKVLQEDAEILSDLFNSEEK